MISPDSMVTLGIQGVVGFATVVGAYFTLKNAVAKAIEEAGEAVRSSAAAHRRIDEHEKRLSAAERDIANQGKNLELALARLEGQVGQMSQRFDALLLRISLPSSQVKI